MTVDELRFENLATSEIASILLDCDRMYGPAVDKASDDAVP